MLVDENGNYVGEVGILIFVTEKVDQETLPTEDRIPAVLDGVKVQIIEHDPWR